MYHILSAFSARRDSFMMLSVSFFARCHMPLDDTLLASLKNTIWRRYATPLPFAVTPSSPLCHRHVRHHCRASPSPPLIVIFTAHTSPETYYHAMPAPVPKRDTRRDHRRFPATHKMPTLCLRAHKRHIGSSLILILPAPTPTSEYA